MIINKPSIITETNTDLSIIELNILLATVK